MENVFKRCKGITEVWLRDIDTKAVDVTLKCMYVKMHKTVFLLDVQFHKPMLP